jgi:tetratricopeptide (TPR) repeat protein
MKRLLLLLCLVAFSSSAQDIATVDSILKSVDLDDSAHVHRIVEALNLSKKLEYEKGEAQAYDYLAYIYCVKRNFKLSIEKNLMAADLYKSIGDDESRAKSYVSIAYAYNEMKLPKEVIRYANMTLDLSKQDSLRAFAYNSLGRGQMALGKTTESFKNFMTAVKRAEDCGKINKVHLFLTGLGNAYLKRKMYDSAIASFWRIQRYANGDTTILGFATI